MNVNVLLQAIHQHYHFHTNHSVPASYGYLLETNCGTKKVMVWQQESTLAWSFLWREKIAKIGLRHTDRFIRTRDGAPYVKVDQYWICVLDETKLTKLTLDGEKSVHLGQWVGYLYRCFFDVSKELSQQDPKLYRQLAESCSKINRSNEKIQRLKKQLTTVQDSLFLSLFRYHWSQIEDRWQRAQMLYKHVQHPFYSQGLLSVSHCGTDPYGQLQISIMDEAMFEGFLGLKGLIGELIHAGDQGQEWAQSFFLSFEEAFNPRFEDHLHLLAAFIYPLPFFEVIDRFFNQSITEEEALQYWMNLCDRQEKMDSFHHWLAKRIDRMREDAISL